MSIVCHLYYLQRIFSTYLYSISSSVSNRICFVRESIGDFVLPPLNCSDFAFSALKVLLANALDLSFSHICSFVVSPYK